MLTFRRLPGVQFTERRGIGFLEGHGELDAGSAFDGLPDNTRRQFITFVDQFLGCQPDISTRYHGYRSKPKYRECYVFKPRGKKKESRFYGFLCHPLKKTRQRFELCVLCINAWKNERETDDAELDRVLVWQSSTATWATIAMEFPDGCEGGTQ